MRPISICITSCNRLKYLKALLKSLSIINEERDKLKLIPHQIIVCDTGSTEVGLTGYLKDTIPSEDLILFDKERDWINDEYLARNALIEASKYDTLMFLQDDGQFIGNHNVLAQVVEDLWKIPDAYCMEIYGVRKVTLRNTVDVTPVMSGDYKYWRRKDRHFVTTGIYKKEVYDNIGEYPTNWPTEKTYWGMSENWYSAQFKQRYPNGQVYRSHVPLMLSIWNDPRGGYTFIRGNKRWGHYLNPDKESGLYYNQNVSSLKNKSIGPVSFMDIVSPIGWQVTVDDDGEQKKYSQWTIMEGEGPYEDLP